MSGDPATIAWYAANAARYLPGLDRQPSRHLDPFLERLAPGARILELGCGGGRDSARIIQRGFDLDATDGTPAMVEFARDNGIEARTMRFDELASREEYDAVWAHACLLHASRADLPRFLGAIYRALRPGGLHFANYKLGTGEARDPLGRLGNFPRVEWLGEIYRDQGFEPVETETYRGSGADGVQRDWFALTVRRPS